MGNSDVVTPDVDGLSVGGPLPMDEGTILKGLKTFILRMAHAEDILCPSPAYFFQLRSTAEHRNENGYYCYQ